jgi:hypothetical protein
LVSGRDGIGRLKGTVIVAFVLGILKSMVE